MRNVLLVKVMLVLWMVFLSACAGLSASLEKPRVKITSIKALQADGFQQRFEIGLSVTNPNTTDIVLRGMSYSIGIGGHDIFSGVTAELPVLKAYTETPIKVAVSANLLSVVALISDLSKQGPENMQYRLDAKLDVGAYLPSISVQESGPVPFLNSRSLSPAQR